MEAETFCYSVDTTTGFGSFYTVFIESLKSFCLCFSRASLCLQIQFKHRVSELQRLYAESQPAPSCAYPCAQPQLAPVPPCFSSLLFQLSVWFIILYLACFTATYFFSRIDFICLVFMLFLSLIILSFQSCTVLLNFSISALPIRGMCFLDHQQKLFTRHW